MGVKHAGQFFQSRQNADLHVKGLVFQAPVRITPSPKLGGFSLDDSCR